MRLVIARVCVCVCAYGGASWVCPRVWGTKALQCLSNKYLMYTKTKNSVQPEFCAYSLSSPATFTVTSKKDPESSVLIGPYCKRAIKQNSTAQHSIRQLLWFCFCVLLSEVVGVVLETR